MPSQKDEKGNTILLPKYTLEGNDVVLWLGRLSFVFEPKAAQQVARRLTEYADKAEAQKKAPLKVKVPFHLTRKFDPFQDCYPDPFPPKDQLIQRLLGDKP